MHDLVRPRTLSAAPVEVLVHQIVESERCDDKPTIESVAREIANKKATEDLCTPSFFARHRRQAST